jgi:hypothetical protein
VAAAEKTLDGDLKDLFEVILALHSELDKQRNDVVHGIWGQAEATPDGIIWSSLQAHANMLLNDYHLEKMGKLVAEERPAQMTKDYFVVKYKDLEELNSSIITLARAIMNFHVYLRFRDQPAGEHAYRRLVSEPLIQRALVRTKKSNTDQE